MNNDFYRATHRYPKGLKKKLIERDGNGCVVCMSKYGLSIHHILESSVTTITANRKQNYVDIEESKKAGKVVGRYSPDGFVLLCASCHGKVHTANPQSRFMQLFYEIVNERRGKLKERLEVAEE